MKNTLTLIILVLNVLTLGASQTVAQRKAIVDGPVTKVEKATPIKISEISMSTGTPPKILGTAGGSVWDMNPVNGISNSSHTPKLLGVITMNFIGFAVGANDTLFGLTSAHITNGYNSHLFVIGPNSGANRFETLSLGTPLYLNGNRYYCSGEGDLAYDKGGALYATCQENNGWKLVTINPGSGAVVIKGAMPTGGWFSALAFNSLGELFALDTYSRKLWKLNKNNPSSNPQPIPLVVGAGQQMPNTSMQGGMGFSATNDLYAAFGGQLSTINPQNGMVTTITANNGGYTSGLAVSGGSAPVRHN